MTDIDLIVFGDTALDNFYEVSQLPAYNQAADINEIRRHYGGMGANTAVVAKKLGIDAALVSVIGTDAEDYRRYMESHGVKLFLQTIFGDTTNSMFFRDKSRQISFFQKGVTEKLDELDPKKEFDHKLPEKTKTLYLARTYTKLHQKAVKNYKDAFKVWNPGYGVFRMNSITDDFQKVLKDCDVLIVNEHELKHLREIGFKLDFSQGPEFYIETRGETGSIVYSKNTEIQVKAYDTKLVDEAGAGDAFNAGFLAAYIKGYDVIESARIGNMTASFIVESWGCQSNLPSWDKVLKRYNESK